MPRIRSLATLALTVLFGLALPLSANAETVVDLLSTQSVKVGQVFCSLDASRSPSQGSCDAFVLDGWCINQLRLQTGVSASSPLDSENFEHRVALPSCAKTAKIGFSYVPSRCVRGQLPIAVQAQVVNQAAQRMSNSWGNGAKTPLGDAMVFGVPCPLAPL